MAMVAGSALVSFDAATRENMAKELEKGFIWDRASAASNRRLPLLYNRIGGVIFLAIGVFCFTSLSFVAFKSDLSAGGAALYVVLDLLGQLIVLTVGFLIIRGCRNGSLNLGRVGAPFVLMAGTKNFFFVIWVITAISGHAVILVRCLSEL